MHAPPQPVIERPPARLWLHELSEMLTWYEQNLYAADLRDPRGYRVLCVPERFPHLIKLLKKDSGKDVEKPKKVVEEIRKGSKGNADFGGYIAERAQALSWIPAIIQRPTKILEVTSLFDKPGDTLYLKEFAKTGYRYRVLVCRRVDRELLVPVTCHPRDHDRYGKNYQIVWP